MKRKVIKIDEELCTGCGACVTGCAEGALQIIDGKAKLVREDFCDGFGNCIGTCPTGALTIEEREAAPFKHTAPTPTPAPKQEFQGCPGMQMKKPAGGKLTQWPIQLHLVAPNSPTFANKELVVMSTCSPVASPDINAEYTNDRGIVLACPKLDKTDPYVDKLASIFATANTPKAIILRMEVPCCGGLTAMTIEAARKANNSKLILEEHILGIDGTIKQISEIDY